MAKLQCDFSAMISPRMFEEFVLPYLWEQCERLDYSVYHLDGVEAIKHLDLILSIPKLTALQWTAGANEPGAGAAEWFEIYRRARKAGKSLLLLDVDGKDVPRLVEELGPEGLLIGTAASSQGACPVREAEELLLAAEVWTKKWRRV
jgi:5-methyltetrahydrofolate--homocysteine methyltransferase